MRASVHVTSPAPPAVGLSPLSLMKNGRASDSSAAATHSSNVPAGATNSKFRAILPEGLRQAFGACAHFPLVIAGDHHRGAVARFVRPRIADPDRGIEHAGCAATSGTCA